MTQRDQVDQGEPSPPAWVKHSVLVPLVGVLASTLLILGLAYTSGVRSERSAELTAEAVVKSNRDATVRALVNETNALKQAARTYAASPDIVGSLTDGSKLATTSARDELSVLVGSVSAPSASVHDLAGDVVALYPFQTTLVGQNFAYRDWFKGAKRTGQPYVSEGYRSAIAGLPVVVGIATPIVTDATKRVGYLLVLWRLDSLRAVAESARRDGGVIIDVTDHAGQSLLTPLKVDAAGEPAVSEVSPLVRSALDGRQVTSNQNGTVVAIGPVEGLGWTVTAQLPQKLATASSSEFRRRQMLNIAFALGMVLLIAGVVSRAGRRRAVDFANVREERRRLRVSDERFRLVFDEGLGGDILVNEQGEILRINATFARLLGVGTEDLLGQPLVSCFADPEDRIQVEAFIAKRSGRRSGEMAIESSTSRPVWGLVAMSWIRETDLHHVLLVQVEDITARREAEKRLTDLALRDELTGLPNRRLLIERFERAFFRAKASGASAQVAALFIDLDGFKAVNDRAGHEVGDQVLKSIGEDFASVVRADDTVARIGGDEFVVLVEDGTSLDYLHSMAQRLVETVRRTVTTDGVELTISASIGIAQVDLSLEPDMSPDRLIRRADSAMYQAKERGRDRYDVFDAQLLASTEARQVLELEMREGLDQNRISLVFQPVIEIDKNVVTGAEALLRLRSADGRLLPTLPAIVAAEEAGLAEQIGDRVLDLALSEVSTWPGSLTIAVNISARELTSRNLSARVEKVLQRYGMDPHQLVLEITETSILRAGPAALAELEALRSIGVRVALDDFGTGYATLQNLISLPVDVVKIDAEFTAGFPGERSHSAVVHGIASMARAMGIPCIVEGVETAEQHEALRGMGLYAQGWLFGESRGPGHVPEMYSELRS